MSYYPRYGTVGGGGRYAATDVSRAADRDSTGAELYSRGHSPTSLRAHPQSSATSLQPSQQPTHDRSRLQASLTAGLHASSTAPSSHYSAPQTVASSLIASDISKRVAELEERLRHIEINEAEGMNVAHKTVKDTLAMTRSLQETSAVLEERIMKDSRHLEELMETKLRGEAEQRGEMERHLRKVLEEEAATLKESLRHSEGLQKDDIDVQLRHVTEQVNKATALMEGRAETLRKEVADSVSVLQGTVEDVLNRLQSQKRAHNEAEANLLSLIEETCNSLQQEIEEERKQRIASHKHLERVLLEATSRQWTKT